MKRKMYNPALDNRPYESQKPVKPVNIHPERKTNDISSKIEVMKKNVEEKFTKEKIEELIGNPKYNPSHGKKLNDDQCERWKKLLTALIGPLAFFATDENLMYVRDQYEIRTYLIFEEQEKLINGEINGPF